MEYGENDFSSQDESFKSGSASRDKILSRDKIFNFLLVIVIFFLY